MVKKTLNHSAAEYYATLGRKNGLSVFVAVIDDEIDLAYLFKEALSQIDGIEVFVFFFPQSWLWSTFRRIMRDTNA